MTRNSEFTCSGILRIPGEECAVTLQQIIEHYVIIAFDFFLMIVYLVSVQTAAFFL